MFMLYATSAYANADDAPHIPEPLVFDLVRPLGAKKAELEFNTIASKPLYNSNKSKKNDPFGTAPTSKDLGSIEWAPEIEYAPVDNFALEFEVPFEESTLEEYKLGLQWTLGTALKNRYIHGIQLLTEPTASFKDWSTTLLYIGGYQFNHSFSTLIMAGGRMNLEGNNRGDSFEKLLNASFFWHVEQDIILGIETNSTYNNMTEKSISLIPQAQFNITENFSIQCGIGFGFESEAREISAIIRPVLSF